MPDSWTLRRVAIALLIASVLSAFLLGGLLVAKVGQDVIRWAVLACAVSSVAAWAAWWRLEDARERGAAEGP